MASLNLGKQPWHVQLALFAALAVGLAGAYYYYYESPLQVTMRAQEAELAAIRARINTGLENARKLPEFRRQIADLEARLDALKPILPEEKDVGDLLRRIQTLATQSNLTILGFRPQPIKTLEMHAEWPIGLQLEGTYHNLGLFLDRVSKFPRIINIGTLTIAQRPQPTDTATITVSCTATTFVLIDQAAAPGGAAAATTSAPVKKTE